MSDLKDIQLSGGWCKHGIMEANRCDLCIDEWKAAGLEVNWQEGNATEFQKAFEEIMTTDNNEPIKLIDMNVVTVEQITLFRNAALAEIKRLNDWADGFSDRQLSERAACEAVLKEQRQEIAALQQQLDALRGDAERLNFLISEECQVWEVNQRFSIRQVTEAHAITNEFPTARDAIDAALKGENNGN